MADIELYGSLFENSPLPSLVFAPDLLLHSINHAGRVELGCQEAITNRPRADFFFFQEITELDENPENPYEMMSSHLERLAKERGRLAWGNGSKIQLWQGEKGERTCRWYEGVVQKVLLGPVAHSPPQSDGSCWWSILLLRALPARFIPTASSLASLSQPNSKASLPSGVLPPRPVMSKTLLADDDQKHQNQDTGLGKYLEPLITQAELSTQELRDIVDYMPHVRCALRK